jgi:hypothetical protein
VPGDVGGCGFGSTEESEPEAGMKTFNRVARWAITNAAIGALAWYGCHGNAIAWNAFRFVVCGFMLGAFCEIALWNNTASLAKMKAKGLSRPVSETLRWIVGTVVIAIPVISGHFFYGGALLFTLLCEDITYDKIEAIGKSDGGGA